MHPVIVKHGRHEPHIVERAHRWRSFAEPFRPLGLRQLVGSERNRARRTVPHDPCRHKNAVSVAHSMHYGSDPRQVEPPCGETMPTAVAMWFLIDHSASAVAVGGCPVLHELAATPPDRVREMIHRFDESEMASLDPQGLAVPAGFGILIEARQSQLRTP